MHPVMSMPLNEALKSGYMFTSGAGPFARWTRVHVAVFDTTPTHAVVSEALYFVVGSVSENKFGIVDSNGFRLFPDNTTRFDTFAEAWQYLQMLKATGGV